MSGVCIPPLKRLLFPDFLKGTGVSANRLRYSSLIRPLVIGSIFCNDTCQDNNCRIE